VTRSLDLRGMKRPPRRRPLAVALALAAVAAAQAAPALATGSWAATASLGSARNAFAAATLSDGTVLVVGGSPVASVGTTAERYEPATETWTATGTMATGRAGHALAALQDGGALVTGGQGPAGILRSAERFDAGSSTWSAVALMATPRANHTATVLADGRVLVVGGITPNGGATNDVEIYNPTTGQWSRASAIRNPRYNHTATLLADGRVLVAGGFTPGSFHTATRKTEVYDPATDSWSFAGSMAEPRAVHAAALLADGRVLVAGGVTSPPNALVVTASAEIWNPVTEQWAPTGSLNTGRRAVEAERLADGRVLVAGGFTPANSLTATAEVFDATTGAWTPTTSMGVPRAPLLVALGDGRVLAIGSVGRILVTAVEAYLP